MRAHERLDKGKRFETKKPRAGELVHHIYPVEERPELALSPDNLVYVSAKTHRA